MTVVVLLLTALVSMAVPSSASPAPGTLLSAHAYTANLLPGVPMAAKAWRVTYSSTNAAGHSTVVGGTVFVPSHPAADTPLIGYAIGTQGLADRCAPSTQFAQGSEYEASLVQSVLAKGWAVALTDYPGLGEPGEHPYIVGPALGPAVLDSMRAARRLPSAHLPKSGPTAIMGYSEGGGAAGWAAQLAARYAPDLHVRAAAVGGVVADLPMIAKSLDNGLFAFLLGYAAIGFDAAYPGLNVERYLTPKGERTFARLKRSCLVGGSLAESPFTRTASLTTRDLFTLPEFAKLMREDSLGAVAPAMPVLLQHSPVDEVLPYGQAVELDHEWTAKGADVTFKPIPAPDHLTGGLLAAPVAISWLSGRFSGGS